MPIFNYFDQVGESIQFIIAIGSIVGFLGLIIGIICFILGNKRMRFQMIELIVISIILLSICGLQTGIKYFRIH